MKKINLRIYSQIRHIVFFKRILRSLFHRDYNDIKKIEMLVMSIDEVLTNIVQHGHKTHGNDIINIDLIMEKNKVQVYITEKGDKYKIDSGHEIENFKNMRRGAGLFLARSLVDDFKYSHKNKVNKISIIQEF